MWKGLKVGTTLTLTNFNIIPDFTRLCSALSREGKKNKLLETTLGLVTFGETTFCETTIQEMIIQEMTI
jgi:hypothetical protein